MLLARRLFRALVTVLAFATAVPGPAAAACGDPPSTFSGTGSRYQLVCGTDVVFSAAEAGAAALGGHLATVTSGAENDFVFALVDTAAAWRANGSGQNVGPWIGLRQTGGPEPSGGWGWVTGEPYGYTNWSAGEPNDNAGLSPEEAGVFWSTSVPGRTPQWNDIGASSPTSGYVVEFDANKQIARATLDFAARASRRKAALRTSVAQLATRLTDLEQQIVTEEKTSQTAIKRLRALDGATRDVDSALDRTRKALEQLKDADEEAPSRVRGLLRAEERYAAKVGQLEAEILDRRSDGDPLGDRRDDLKQARKALDAIQDTLTERLAGTTFGDLRASWLKQLRALARASFELHDEQKALLARLGASEAKLTAVTGQLGTVYRQLLTEAERLAGFDPEVQQIDVTAGGQPVFRAAATSSYASLLALNEQIAAQDGLITTIEANKKNAFAAFKVATDQAIASGRELASVILKVAGGQFATKLAFDSFDIIKATAKGGVVGAASELGKKLLEKAVEEYAGTPSGQFEPGSIEAEVNRTYEAGLKDSFSAPSLTRLVGSRILKDTASKALKDGLVNPYLGAALFRRIEMPVRQLLGDSPVAPGQLVSQLQNFTLKIKRIDRLQGQLKELSKGYLSNFKDKPSMKKFFKGVGESIIKDAAKTIIKGYLEGKEREAWRDYFVKNALSRAMYAPYAQYANLWEEALQRRDELLATKATLLAGLDDRGGLTASLSEAFNANAQLQVVLTLNGTRDPADPVLVLVGGSPATRVGTTDTYTVGASAATADADGMLTVLLR